MFCRGNQGKSISVLIFFFQLCGVKEGIPPLQGATVQLLGQALCGGSPSLCFYLQQWQRSCRKRSHKLIHSSGGIQWGSTGNGEGQSESCCLFIHRARTLQVAVHLYHRGVISALRKMDLSCGDMEDPAHRAPSWFRVSCGFGHRPWLLSHTRSALRSMCWYHHPVLGFCSFLCMFFRLVCFVCFKNKTPQNNTYKHPARNQMSSAGPSQQLLKLTLSS